MPPLYHILTIAAVVAWDVAVLAAIIRHARPRRLPPPRVAPTPRPRRWPWQHGDDVVDVYYDLW